MEVGDYVRTNDGYINKIKKVNQWNVLVDARDLFGEEINIANNEIIKSSPNIIDLIEVGDYVNGYKVYYCYCADEDSTGLFIDTEKGREWLDKSNQIKSIVTKEMFTNAEYRVETN